METRTFSKRDATGEDVFQVSLEKQRLKLRWGRAGKDLRLQRLKFNTLDEARAAYQARLEELNARGYLDATTE
jgi:predicted DNA-binding WGR domain protein